MCDCLLLAVSKLPPMKSKGRWHADLSFVFNDTKNNNKRLNTWAKVTDALLESWIIPSV